ncbi:MAG: hypothetical protein A4S09_08625 [Proteobacteria bacterium SG_bin7]|nr:MAG: hypothetical protein A4S09_08625 [Proteobacteria bacterium SG_bin7]
MGDRDLILSLLRSCTHCGSFWGTTDILCGSCWERLERALLRGSSQEFGNYHFKVHSLLNWNHAEHNLIKNLIHGLKTGWAKSVYRRLAAFLDVKWPKESILIPAPGPEHAKAWALAVSELTGLEVQDFLIKFENGKQKTKSKLERQAIKMGLKQGIFRDHKSIIFVDDVVSTGGTAFAAHRALGEPKNFEVCSIVCNPSWSSAGPRDQVSSN